MKKIMLLIALAAVAYLLGAKDGRARLMRLKESVGHKGHAWGEAAGAAAEKVHDKVTEAVDRVADSAQEIADQVTDLADSVSNR